MKRITEHLATIFFLFWISSIFIFRFMWNLVDYLILINLILLQMFSIHFYLTCFTIDWRIGRKVALDFLFLIVFVKIQIVELVFLSVLFVATTGYLNTFLAIFKGYRLPRTSIKLVSLFQAFWTLFVNENDRVFFKFY